MALIQNDDNKCPTTKQVNDALQSMGGGGVQTLILTTPELISLNRDSNLELNSSDAVVMDTVKSNMTNNIPFQLMYYGLRGSSTISAPITITSLPLGGMFTLYVIVDSKIPYKFSLNKVSSPKWVASKLLNT